MLMRGILQDIYLLGGAGMFPDVEEYTDFIIDRGSTDIVRPFSGPQNAV